MPHLKLIQLILVLRDYLLHLRLNALCFVLRQLDAQLLNHIIWNKLLVLTLCQELVVKLLSKPLCTDRCYLPLLPLFIMPRHLPPVHLKRLPAVKICADFFRVSLAPDVIVQVVSAIRRRHNDEFSIFCT